MFWNVTQVLLDGLLTTFQIFLFTLLFSLPFGLVLAFGSMSRWRPLRYLIQVLVWIIRGTPLMLQLIIIFYGPGLWLGHNIWSGNESGRITATVVAFSINYACYFAAYELTFAGYSFMKSNGLTWPLFYTGVFYLIFVGVLTLLFNYMERKLDYFR